MKTILLTGVRGFIGSYFHLKYSQHYNIRTFSFLQENCEALHVEDMDVVVHLSALVHQMGGASKEEYEKVNVTQTLKLAKKAKESGVKQFVFMSSVKVYGEESDVCYTQSTTCNPHDEYGKSKLKAEQELLKLEDESFTVSIIRTPIVYGHGVKANIKNLVNLIHKVPVLPFGGIGNRRSMIYIGNLCVFIEAIIERQKSGIFLVSDEEPLSTTRLIELIAENLDKKVYLVRVPFFESLLRVLKPSFHKRLYGSLEVDNQETLRRLFGEAKASLPFSVKEGISFMINGEKNLEDLIR